MAKKREPVQEQQVEPAEKLSRTEAANRAVKHYLGNGGDFTLDEAAEMADKLFRAARPNVEEDLETAGWGVQAVLEQLESTGIVALTWHCAVHPNVRLPGNGH
jgi:hypothetical protein